MFEFNQYKYEKSEMYIVRQTYYPKAYTVIMRRGQTPLREGALNPDPLNTVFAYGLVPEQTYTGLLRLSM